MEEYLNEARSYSDSRLKNMISQSQNFNDNAVKAAKAVALERGLISEGGLTQIANQSNLVKDAKSMLERKMTAEQVLEYFITQGVDEKEAESAIFEAAKTANMSKESLEEIEKKEGSSSIWWYLFIGFFVIRMIMRFFRN